MKFTISSEMGKHASTELIDALYKTKHLVTSIRSMKIPDIECQLKHAFWMCADAGSFVLNRGVLSGDGMTGMDLVMLDHLINSIEDTCYEINKCQEIPEELRDELKASLRGIREVFSMDHRW
jgi:hypothetical protein